MATTLAERLNKEQGTNKRDMMGHLHLFFVLGGIVNSGFEQAAVQLDFDQN
jgi:hypothetical protein